MTFFQAQFYYFSSYKSVESNVKQHTWVLFFFLSPHPTDPCHDDHHSDLEDRDKYPPEVQPDLTYAKVSTLRLYTFKGYWRNWKRYKEELIRWFQA